jgi:membrane protein implicated in regulation of membrane protease activity
MDTLKTAVETMNTVPTEFWFAASLILTSILVWVFKHYMDKMDKQSQEFRTSIQDLVVLVKIHDKDIKDHDVDIKELQKLVNSRKPGSTRR